MSIQPMNRLLLTLLPICLLCFSWAGCELLTEVVEDLRVVSFRYKFVPPTLPADSALARSSGAQVAWRSDMRTFIAEPNDFNQNYCRIFGALGTGQPSTFQLLRINPSPTNDSLPTGLSINFQGILEAGETYPDVPIEVLMGDRQGQNKEYEFQGNVYARLTITELDTTNRIIGGTFHGYLRNAAGRTQLPALVILDGTFRQSYSLR